VATNISTLELLPVRGERCHQHGDRWTLVPRPAVSTAPSASACTSTLNCLVIPSDLPAPRREDGQFL
jgi:hypothetical protein